MRHVHHLSSRVEPPLEVDVGLRVGDHLARDPGGLLPGNPEDLNLVGLAVGGDWKGSKYIDYDTEVVVAQVVEQQPSVWAGQVQIPGQTYAFSV